ncbi:MAG: DUF1801 domain-containing protein [Ilumatobacteraceae bacterium]
MDPAVQTYVDGIIADTRALFDRIHQLIVGEFADIDIGIAYKMPVYRRGNRSLNVGAWKHGVSFYGFPDEGALPILERHPALFSGKGTLRITHTVADDIRDEELIQLVHSAMGGGRAPLPE